MTATRLVAVVAAMFALGCEDRKPSSTSTTPSTASGSDASSADPTRLHPVAQLRGIPMLVEGTRKIALRFIDEAFWYETEPGKLVARDEVGLAVAREIANLGGSLPDVALGTHPIISGGEHDHHANVRVDAQAAEVPIEGFVMDIATFTDGSEVWRIEAHAHKQLAIVYANGKVTRPPAFERLGAVTETMSPVSAKICQHPAAIDLSSNGTIAVALIRECDKAAPVRLAKFQLPGPTLSTVVLPSTEQLGFDIVAIGVSRTGEVAFVGAKGSGAQRSDRGDRTLVVGRVDGAGKVSSQMGPELASSVVRDAEVADDGAVWSVVGDQLFRGVVPVALESPDQIRLAPIALGVDAHLGIVTIGYNGKETKWLFAERPPAGAAIAIPPR